jgi:hypothetical protein
LIINLNYNTHGKKNDPIDDPDIRNDISDRTEFLHRPVECCKNACGQEQSPSVKPLPNPETDLLQILNEGFDDITTLVPSGWYMINMSNPIGGLSWFQGNGTVFNAYDGGANAYIGVNFNCTYPVGTISNWLMTPVYQIQNGDVLTFYTCAAGQTWPDRLQVLLSISGNSTNVGSDEFSVGDFTYLLLDINPGLAQYAYPETWTLYSATVTGLPEAQEGRFAFRYFVTDGGISGNNSNYLGIDRVQFAETAVVPVSNWALIIGIGLILAFSVIRFRKSS